MLDQQFRSKKTLPDGILIGLLGVGCSRREQKCRAKPENSRFHLFLLVYLQGYLRGDTQIRLAEPRHLPQNLLPWIRQQDIAGRSPLRQRLRGGKFVRRNGSGYSPV